MEAKLKNLLFTVSLMLCSPVASALDMPELAMKKNCGGCHAIDKKVVGPAWSEVAKQYKGNQEAPVVLVNKIKQGGFGIWGALPMPAQHISDEDARTLVKFILGLSGEPPKIISKR